LGTLSDHFGDPGIQGVTQQALGGPGVHFYRFSALTRPGGGRRRDAAFPSTLNNTLPLQVEFYHQVGNMKPTWLPEVSKIM